MHANTAAGELHSLVSNLAQAGAEQAMGTLRYIVLQQQAAAIPAKEMRAIIKLLFTVEERPDMQNAVDQARRAVELRGHMPASFLASFFALVFLTMTEYRRLVRAAGQPISLCVCASFFDLTRPFGLIPPFGLTPLICYIVPWQVCYQSDWCTLIAIDARVH